MTEQYQQNNINVPMTFARNIDQSDIDTSLPVDGVPLNEDDEYLFARDINDIDYTVFLPNVAEIPGKDIVVKVDPGAGLLGLPTLSALQTTTPVQTIEGVATLGPLAAGDSVILRADPPDLSTTPATPATNWSIIKTGAP